MSRPDLSHTLEILKAAFPYLDYPTRETLVLFIKAGELIECLNMRQHKGDISAFSISDDNKNGDETDMVGMLKSVRKVCKDDEVEIIDTLLNITNALEVYETYRNLYSMMSTGDNLGGLGSMLGMGNLSNNPEDMIEILGQMISPEDKETLENVNTILKMMNSSNSDDSEEEKTTQEYEKINDFEYSNNDEFDSLKGSDDYYNDFAESYKNYMKDEDNDLN